MTREDILQNPRDKMAFELARRLLLKGNNRVNETTLFDVADILLKLSEEKDKNIELQKEVYDLYTMRSVEVTPKKELVEMLISQTIAKNMVNVIAKDLTLSRRIIVMLFSRWRENRNSLTDRKKIYGDKPFDIPSDLVLRDYELTYKKAYKMLKEHTCKTR